MYVCIWNFGWSNQHIYSEILYEKSEARVALAIWHIEYCHQRRNEMPLTGIDSDIEIRSKEVKNSHDCSSLTRRSLAPYHWCDHHICTTAPLKFNASASSFNFPWPNPKLSSILFLSNRKSLEIPALKPGTRILPSRLSFFRHIMFLHDSPFYLCATRVEILPVYVSCPLCSR